MLGHADCRESVDAHAKAHLDIGPGGSADGVDQTVLRWCFARLGLEHEEALLVPGDFMCLHPEAIQRYLVGGLLILAGGSVAVGCSHAEFTGSDGNHVV